MAKKIKVGIIGLGWPGREHLKGYLQSARAEGRTCGPMSFHAG
ncbi:MAG: hypothetical protein O2782_19545 [bacterium]|nr:hypothetical protein [bacterium]